MVHFSFAVRPGFGFRQSVACRPWDAAVGRGVESTGDSAQAVRSFGSGISRGPPIFEVACQRGIRSHREVLVGGARV